MKKGGPIALASFVMPKFLMRPSILARSIEVDLLSLENVHGNCERRGQLSIPSVFNLVISPSSWGRHAKLILPLKNKRTASLLVCLSLPIEEGSLVKDSQLEIDRLRVPREFFQVPASASIP